MPGCIRILKAFSAQKQILAGMSELCLGMFVVCPGMLEYSRLYP